MDQKHKLRAEMRSLRRDHVAALADATRGLLFLRPPAAIAALADEGAAVGIYHATAFEAPTRSYARWLYENGREVALPWFAGRSAPMRFRLWDNPYDDDGLEIGPYGQLQPPAAAPEMKPVLAFVPLLAFTADGHRLGQGGGHYDRWLETHPDTMAVGLAWDCQRVDALPIEPHDRVLEAVVTPTRLYRGED